MKIVYATNNKNGLLVLKELINQGVEIEYLIMHPRDKANYYDEIISISNVNKNNLIIWNKKNIENIKNKLKNKKSEILFSVNFAYIIPDQILKLFKLPINLHTGYLPYNKGKNPNVWSIIENTPAGVTIHKMSSKLDDGEILFQEKVKVTMQDTGKTLYKKLEEKSVEMVKKYFKQIIEGNFTLKKNDVGTYHTQKDFKNICKIDLEKSYKAKDFINLLRALTFAPYKNAYFVDRNGNKIYIEIKLCKDECNEKDCI